MSFPDIPRQTLHCHSCYSDGVAKPDELIAAATAAGFTRIGISDHLVLHPALGVVGWSMKLDWIDSYIDAIHAASEHADIEVLVGLEVDYFPEESWRRELDTVLRGRAIDYLIGSIHYLDRFNIDGSADAWLDLSPEDIADAHRHYWERMAAMATMGGWAFLGHLDLPKKFDILPPEEPQEAIDVALAAIARSSIPIELNTAGWDKPCRAPYPGTDLLRQCQAVGIPVLVNDDAHVPGHLGRYYERVPAILDIAGYHQVESLRPTWDRLHP